MVRTKLEIKTPPIKVVSLVPGRAYMSLESVVFIMMEEHEAFVLYGCGMYEDQSVIDVHIILEDIDALTLDDSNYLLSATCCEVDVTITITEKGKRK